MNNIHIALAYFRLYDFNFAELHINIALLSLWMGAGMHKKMRWG
jgi:hypothetical protein